MDWTEARNRCERGAIVRRKGWATSTSLIYLPQYKTFYLHNTMFGMLTKYMDSLPQAYHDTVALDWEEVATDGEV